MADLSFVNTREFSRLISRPSTLTVFDMAMLEDLVVLYPFSIPLHVSYAFALKKFKPEKYESYISKAALYTPDRTLLNKIIKHISDFENDENKPKTSQYILDDYQEQDQPTTENLPAENLSDGDVPHLNLGNNTEEDISSEDGLETESPSFNEEIPDDKWLNTQLQDTDILPSAIEDEETLDNTEGITTFFEEKAQNTGSTNFIEEEEQVKDENETTLSDDGIKDVSDSDQSPQTEIAHADEISNFTESLEVPEQPEIQHELASEDQEEVMQEEVVSEKLVEEDETVAELTEPELEAPESVKEEDFHTEIEEVSNLEQQIPLIADEDAQTNIEERVEETAIYEPQASIRPILPVTPFENTIETVIPDSDHLQFDEQIKENTIEENDIVKENPLLQNEIIGSVASTNFFVFDHSSVDPLLKEEVDVKAESATFPSTPQIRQGEVAKYDDDKMPFSFLWWLDKTRKEHADNLQPYAAKGSTSIPAKKDTSGQLNQQILENIYHIQPEINVFQNQFAKPISFGIKRKEDAIIEKFIIEDPQIRPPKDDKLDTENKARKSSEDNLDMVSETLAKIYTDQMLYHKAIDTYRKLSLKFPEKSTYFAGRIRELEKKFN